MSEQASLESFQRGMRPYAPPLEVLRSVVRFRNLGEEQVEGIINVWDWDEVSETRKYGKRVGGEQGERRSG